MEIKSSHIPVLAVTMGDPAGIGPEIAIKTFAKQETYLKCKPVLVGHAVTITDTLHQLGTKLQTNCIQKISDAKFKFGTIDIISIGENYTDIIEKGKISAEAGDIAFKSVVKAIELAKTKEVDGTVTGPIHKEAIHMAGHKFSGHTEIYAHYTNTKKYAMLLVDDHFRVIHVTTHVSLREACDLIKKERVLEVIHLLNTGLLKLGIHQPRIGVAGLNPHSGDGRLFGNEDIEEILPAVKEANSQGLSVAGPIPSDSLFAEANGGKYDGCVAMYHDQGHIPFKLLGFNYDKEKKTMKSVRGVNITLGLPILRTSVDHGTAFEIAGKGLASPDALIQAIDYATKLLN
jgi:4-hydroxythreonine-4-phosphate dehydrogenase